MVLTPVILDLPTRTRRLASESLYICRCKLLCIILLSVVISGIATTEGRKSGQRSPGDFNFNPLNMGKSPASARDLALKEVRNGRLAMIAAAGMLVQACTTPEGALGNLF
jgi:hypothetical protein